MALTAQRSTVEFHRTAETIGADLIGHEARWAALTRAFERDRVPQTLLFSGPRSVGKTTIARRFAQLLLCQSPVRDERELLAPCGLCRACHQVVVGSYPDLRVFRPLLKAEEKESNWQEAPEGLESSGFYIGQARKLRQEAGYLPTAGPRKVLFVYEADKMNPESQNALLKTFEEPARGLYLFLISDKTQKLMSTVRSRCCELPFPLVPDETLHAWLQSRGEVPQVMDAAVRVAQGRPGAAIREIERLNAAQARGEIVSSRFEQANDLLERIESAAAFGGLALAEAAQTLGESWSDNILDTAELDAKTLKTISNNLKRAGIMAVLDELRGAYRARWKTALTAGYSGEAYAHGLDLIAQTRHYISGNANAGLALDVLFSRLIALHAPRRTESRSTSMRR
jgi:DNA polymerase III delta' subunit